MKKMKVAVIGVGNMGQHHARVYSQIKEVKLAAVSDLNEKKGGEIAKNYGALFFKDYKKLIPEIPDINVVSIAVPTKYHSEVACYFLKNKINVLLEKPIADSVQAAKKIIRTAQENKVKLMVGHIERFNPAVIKLKELIQRGKLGQIISIIARRVGGFPAQIKDSNVIIDLAVHDIDIINYLIGEKPRKVYKHQAKFHAHSQEDAGEIFLIYKKAAGFVQINWVTPVKIRTLTITGTKAFAHLDYINQELIFYKAKVEKKISNFAEFIKFSQPKTQKVQIQKEEPLKLEILSFLEAIRKNREPKVSLEEALETLKICLQEGK